MGAGRGEADGTGIEMQSKTNMRTNSRKSSQAHKSIGGLVLKAQLLTL